MIENKLSLRKTILRMKNVIQEFSENKKEKVMF